MPVYLINPWLQKYQNHLRAKVCFSFLVFWTFSTLFPLAWGRRVSDLGTERLWDWPPTVAGLSCWSLGPRTWYFLVEKGREGGREGECLSWPSMAGLWWTFFLINVCLLIYFWLHWVFIQVFSSCDEQGLLFIAAHRLLVTVASLIFF